MKRMMNIIKGSNFDEIVLAVLNQVDKSLWDNKFGYGGFTGLGVAQ